MHQALSDLAAETATHMKPEARGAAVAATLRELASLATTSASMLDLAVGYQHLAASRRSDAPPVAARRATCAELASLAGAADIGEDHDPAPQLAVCVDLWGELSSRIAEQVTADPDPRLSAIAATLLRESLELEAVLESLS